MRMNKKLKFSDGEAGQINHVLKKRLWHKRWQKTVSVLALLVIVISGYAMMRPAITMDQESFCGQSIEVPKETADSQAWEKTAETMPQTSGSQEASISKTGDYYSIYDSSAHRKVLDPQGNLDAEWSLCLNHLKDSPGTSTQATGEYIKIADPTEAQYAEFSGNDTPGNFQRVKRILYAKAKLYPVYNYAVFQNELYYTITGLEKYNTNWGNDDLNAQKMQIRAVEESAAYDADIESGLEVVIYRAKDRRLQNTITATFRNQPDKVSIPVTKVWSGTPAESVTVRLLADGELVSAVQLSEQNHWRYVFQNLDKYTSGGHRIMYTLTEDAVTGYETVISGGCDYGACGFTVTNIETGTAELSVTKLVTGAGGDQNEEFHFRINLANGGNDLLTGEYQAYRNGRPERVTVDEEGNARITLKHNESIRITGLPSGFYYIITEEEADQNGYTTAVDRPDPEEQSDDMGGVNNYLGDDGATGNVAVTFTNNRDVPAGYPVEVSAHKTLGGGPPQNGQFTFILTDSEGREAGRQTNDATGTVTFPLNLPAPGQYDYTLRELNDGQGGIAYDERIYTVQIRVTAPAAPEDPPEITVAYDGGPGPAEFQNLYSYVLPETGGTGVNEYMGGGTALVLASLLSLYMIKLVHRKEGCF